MDSPNTLASLRQNIDALDSQLLSLVQQRAELSVQVGALKQSSDPGSSSSVYRPEREQAIVARLQALNTGPLLPAHIAALWREIFSASRSLQQALNVAFLGPLGTYSHAALLESLGHSCQPVPCENLETVFRRVHDGQCQLGVVPLENSLQGSVGQSCDLFLNHDVHIIGEHSCRISHSLLGSPALAGITFPQKPGTPYSAAHPTIERVLSHPQALAQCSAWLNAHLPGLPQIPTDSTAAAAHRALTEAGSVALASASLAPALKLHVLAPNIENEARNFTRFALLAPGLFNVHTPALNTASKSSLLFTTPDQAGALAEVLSILASDGINLHKLESRPLHLPSEQTWRYVFFADTDGDIRKAPATLQKLRNACPLFRVLGTYPLQA